MTFQHLQYVGKQDNSQLDLLLALTLLSFTFHFLFRFISLFCSTFHSPNLICFFCPFCVVPFIQTVYLLFIFLFPFFTFSILFFHFNFSFQPFSQFFCFSVSLFLPSSVSEHHLLWHLHWLDGWRDHLVPDQTRSIQHK
jgi:hypothetical protein